MTTVKAQLTSLPLLLKQRLGANWSLYFNAGSLVATTAVTSGLGFVYWWVAARLFPQAAVGFASAAVSAMMLLAAVGVLGLSTLLITEIGRNRQNAGSIAVTAMLVVGGVSAIIGVLFALLAPSLSQELAPLASSAGNVLIFAVGVALTAVTVIADQVMIALLRGSLQLSRNILFAVSKLIVLYGFATLVSQETGLNIYVAWMLGNVISLAGIALLLFTRRTRILYRPQFGFIRHLGRAALAHHATNLILQTPSLILPVLVTTLLSASANASFYAAWMVASFVFVLPAHLTTVLHAVGAKSPGLIVTKMRSTIKFAFLGALPLGAVLVMSAGLILSLFGKQYVAQAEWCLRILSLAVFPLIIKYHYVALVRVFNRVQEALPLLFLGCVLEITLAVIGLKLGALTGLSLGWFLATCIEAGIMFLKLRQMVGELKTRAG